MSFANHPKHKESNIASSWIHSFSSSSHSARNLALSSHQSQHPPSLPHTLNKTYFTFKLQKSLESHRNGSRKGIQNLHFINQHRRKIYFLKIYCEISPSLSAYQFDFPSYTVILLNHLSPPTSCSSACPRVLSHSFRGEAE